MKIINKLTFAALATGAALAATLLFQPSITRADDHGQRGGDNERGDRHDRDHDQRIDDRFAVLLDGVYKNVAKGEGPKDNLGLTTVDLNDGSYFKVKIYPVSGIPGDQDKAIGSFYVWIGNTIGAPVAYDLPGGAFTARFVRSHDDAEQLPGSPGAGQSWTLDGTFYLDILEATGIYKRFAGGHIHMVDILKFRGGDSTFLENCFCFFHRKLVDPNL